MKTRSMFFLAVAILLSAGAFALPPPRWFPLDPGNTWTYACEEFPGWRLVSQVIALEGDRVLVALGGNMVYLSGTSDAVDIDLPGEGLVPFYRFSEASFVHRDISDCDDGVMVTAADIREDVKTPAGIFSGCLRLDFRNEMCSDAGRISEWWAPEVGLVKWIDDSFTGPRTWVLESFERRPVGRPFLRGDADGDRELNITDAIRTLEWLFLGGPAPSCEDAADLNDEGRIDISDPVSLLGYLFLGLPAPPPPGPATPGFDPTPDDPFLCGDPPAFDGAEESLSNLPGVRFDLSSVPSVLTIGQVARGVTFVYRTAVEEPIPAVTPFPLDDGRCDRPDTSGLAVLERILGGDRQLYCLCDTGHCAPADLEVDLVPGTWETTFPWDGRNWNGPSDTGNPEGAPFPSGIYWFEVRAAGARNDLSGGQILFELWTRKRFLLVP